MIDLSIVFDHLAGFLEGITLNIFEQLYAYLGIKRKLPARFDAHCFQGAA